MTPSGPTQSGPTQSGTEQHRGTSLAVAAYGLWGLMPLYWVLLRPAGPVEVLAHRIVWSLVFMLGVLLALRRWRWVVAALRRPRLLGGLAVAAVLIGINWGTFIYGVDTNRVVEVALGYFVNPLVSVLLGVVVLRERLRVAQWVALAIGAAAVLVLAVGYGGLPWIALTLACSFGLYGLVKKMVAAPPIEGMAIESAVLFLPALGYLGWFAAAGDLTFGSVSAPHTLLLVGAGAATAVPLLLFAGAANRVSLTVLGMTQYLAPTLHFLIGVLVLGEPMPPLRLVGFVLVWAALVIFTVDGLHRSRRAHRRATELANAV